MSRKNARNRAKRMAVGRIEMFWSVEDQIAVSKEYTDKAEFKAKIKEEIEGGLPFKAYIYRGISGQPKCRVKAEGLNKETCEIKIIDNPYIEYLKAYYGK